ncbi:hypothetical protein Thiowin_00339 [Thiorhodovibrio winogradskyi]|uniref:YecA family protein n=1 Tax=Thiorhodovibrio winogradskyi TaxID=77007 RepID=A0ABZ0S2K3_9GAMM|nr:YecA family protein [Thiorhodovibrio winogradskyi]
MSAEHSSHASTLADHPSLEHLSDLSELALTPSEAHGIYCGLLCSGERDCLARWLDEILPKTPTSDHDTANCRAALTAVAEQTLTSIQGPRRAFTPLLPSADAPLVARAEGVNDWSRGFLYGLGLNGRDPNSFSVITRDALADLTEVTRMDVNDLGDSEDNEQALAEVTEFLWVAAMLVYEEQGPTQAH